MKNIHYQDLTARDADDIARVEKQVYEHDNPDFILGANDFYEDLKEADESNTNFSIGAYDESKQLIGYTICYQDESEKNDAPAAYISDIAIAPEHRAHKNQPLQERTVFQMIERVAQKVKKLQLPVEAEFRHTSYKMIKKHPEIVASFGYQTTDELLLPNYNAGEDHHWMRFEPQK